MCNAFVGSGFKLDTGTVINCTNCNNIPGYYLRVVKHIIVNVGLKNYAFKSDAF